LKQLAAILVLDATREAQHFKLSDVWSYMS